MYDDDVDGFLDDYVREDERFGDDTLDFEVNEGVVTVTGQLDDQEELDALQARIRRVPGVRDVNAERVQVGGA
jgi:osmotically-inducible protein OsmY